MINFIPGDEALPGRFTYVNFGRMMQKGFELGIDSPVNASLNVFANYSYQATPDPKDFDLSELNLPPRTVSTSGCRSIGAIPGELLGRTTPTTRSGRTCSTTAYHGTTKPYTLVNAGFGVRWGTKNQSRRRLRRRTSPTRQSSSMCSATS